MGALASGQWFFKEALVASTIGSAMLPPVRITALVALETQCSPGAIEDGANQWMETAKKLKEAAEGIENRVKGVDKSTWTGDDREAFDQKISEFVRHLKTAAFAATLIAVTLLLYAFILFIFGIYLAVMATVLLAIAIAYLAQSWIPGYGQGFMAWANTFATTVGMQLRATAAQLRTVAQTAAGMIAALTGGNVAFQLATGSDTAAGDLLQSTLYSIDEIAISFVENKIAGGPGSKGFTGTTKGLLGKSFWGGFGYQTADTFGLSPSSNFRQQGPDTWGVPDGGKYANPIDPEPDIPTF
ncbi:hypothetical protein E1264_41270 [Actinomadura sp. KC216]|uniref:WXG100 family type VII secretion target n=1 Tax=Actinomadura sp. KC216 TaxID=2530370 RepID=UPI001051A373|nr:hypothetical protein [Actinomadura sp. KC216]TDB73844.1 hypothetical protein E1264_41270 [Actinomadura sp. KC216]